MVPMLLPVLWVCNALQVESGNGMSSGFSVRPFGGTVQEFQFSTLKQYVPSGGSPSNTPQTKSGGFHPRLAFLGVLPDAYLLSSRVCLLASLLQW